MTEQNTEFNYLLNAVENAAREKYPAKAGYASKRKAMMEHVRELERKAALWNLIESMWSFPGQTLGDVVKRIEAERHAGAPVAGPLNGIAATDFHGEGAIARCSYCGRYSLNRKTLGEDRYQPVCECGEKHGWSGSFKKPSPDAKWSGKAPSGVALGGEHG